MNEADFTRLIRSARRDGFLDLRRFCDARSHGTVEWIIPKAARRDLYARHREYCEEAGLPAHIVIERTRAKSFVSIGRCPPPPLVRELEGMEDAEFDRFVSEAMRDCLISHSELMALYVRESGILSEVAWNPSFQCYLVEIVDCDFIGIFSMTYRLKHKHARLFARAAVEHFSRPSKGKRKLKVA